MNRIDLKSTLRFFNVQKIAALFFILLIITAYSVTYKNNVIAYQKQKMVNIVKKQQEAGISTLVVTSLPLWLAIRDKLTSKDN